MYLIRQKAFILGHLGDIMVEVIGIIKNHMLGSTTQNPKQYVVEVADYDKKKASALIGKNVAWTTVTKKEIAGKVAGVHGNKGALRVVFNRGLPGTAIGTKVKIK